MYCRNYRSAISGSRHYILVLYELRGTGSHGECRGLYMIPVHVWLVRFVWDFSNKEMSLACCRRHNYWAPIIFRTTQNSTIESFPPTYIRYPSLGSAWKGSDKAGMKDRSVPWLPTAPSTEVPRSSQMLSHMKSSCPFASLPPPARRRSLPSQMYLV